MTAENPEIAAARRAIACTATGALSGLPKWEWLPGMVHVDTLRACSRRVLQVGKPPGRWPTAAVYMALEGLAGWVPQISGYADYPDFTDQATILLMVPLVQRAWADHEVRLHTNIVDCRLCSHALCIIDGSGHRVHAGNGSTLYDLLTNALEHAP